MPTRSRPATRTPKPLPPHGVSSHEQADPTADEAAATRAPPDEAEGEAAGRSPGLPPATNAQGVAGKDGCKSPAASDTITTNSACPARLPPAAYA